MSPTKMNKKGAIELSIGTVVIIVLAMTMLILGLVLVRNIFTGATENVDTLNDKVKGEIVNLFSDSGSSIAVKLGGDRTAKIKAGTDLGIGLGAQPKQGGLAKDLKYQLTISSTTPPSPTECITKLGGQQGFISLFEQPSLFSSQTLFDEWEGSSAFSIIRINVPDGTPICSQKVQVDVYDAVPGRSSTDPNYNVGRSFFIIQIEKKGFF